MAEQRIGEIDKDRGIEKNKGSRRQDSDWAGTTAGMGATTAGMGETIGDTATSTVGQVGTMVGQARDQVRQIAGDTMEQARNTARNLGDQAHSAMADPGATAQELARRAREQAVIAGDALYQQGTRAGEYLTQHVNEYPLAALLIAGAIGYGLAYLIHSQR